MSKFISILFTLILICTAGLSIAEDLSIRPKNFIVTPSTGPICEIIVHNKSTSAYQGTITPEFIKGWKVAPLSQRVELNANETKLIPFAIESGTDLVANIYPVTVSAEAGSTKTVVKVDVVCASTPYYKPVIDGKLDEWADAIPIKFMTKGKSTVVRSYWNKEQFSLAVEVEEDKLIGLTDADQKIGLDAIQFVLSPKSGAVTERHEFLAADSASIWKADRCFQLAQNGKSPDEKSELADLILKEAKIKVSRSGSITTYELSIPIKPMQNLRATAGREYCFNLLVHDPDGTGIRDLGSVMNLSTSERNKDSWSNWKFAKWNGYVPYGIGIEFGFCSSIH